MANFPDSTPSFDIRDHLDKLTKAKGANRYICPVCEGNNLTIESESGKYKCWSECETKDIREALSPWDEVKHNRTSSNSKKQHSKNKQQSKPAPIPDDFELAKLPEQSKLPEKRQKGQNTETEYPYGDAGLVIRTDKPDGSKVTIPYHLDEEGKKKKGKGDCTWRPYRFDEIEKYGSGKWVIGVEGEKCVEAARWLQLVSFTFQGGSWSKTDLESACFQIKKAGVKAILYIPDNDEPGQKKANNLAKAAAKAKLPIIVVEPLTHSIEGGDIADWVDKALKEKGMSRERVLDNLEKQMAQLVRKEVLNQPSESDEAEDESSQHDKANSEVKPRSAYEVKPESENSEVPEADIIGDELAEDYRDRLLWNGEHQTWMQYELERTGVWSAVREDFIESIIYSVIKARGIEGFGSNSYIKNVVASMQHQLFTRLWLEKPATEIMPFEDGVLYLETNEFLDHAPGHRLTWQLPRKYRDTSNTGWQSIDNWLTETTKGDERKKQILLCFSAAALRGRCDLHKFLYLIGVGGTGKSSFTRLLEMIIGSENVWSGDFSELSDKNAVVELMNKRLAILPDQDKVTDKLSNFKRLTGQDNLRGRHLYKNWISFRFSGMAIVTSNAPVFASVGGASWLTRRQIMVDFTYKPKQSRNLEKEFEPELSAFTQHLLSISSEEITRVLEGINQENLQPVTWENLTRNDSIAAWLDEWVIRDPQVESKVGNDRNEWGVGTYDPRKATLFGSYCLYCKQAGLQPKSKNNFSSDLEELCQQTLKWAEVKRLKLKQHSAIRGIRLRTCKDSAAKISTDLTAQNLSDEQYDDLANDECEQYKRCSPRCEPGGDLGGDLKPAHGGDGANVADLEGEKVSESGKDSKLPTDSQTASEDTDFKKSFGAKVNNVCTIQANSGSEVTTEVTTRSPSRSTPDSNSGNSTDKPSQDSNVVETVDKDSLYLGHYKLLKCPSNGKIYRYVEYDHLIEEFIFIEPDGDNPNKEIAIPFENGLWDWEVIEYNSATET